MEMVKIHNGQSLEIEKSQNWEGVEMQKSLNWESGEMQKSQNWESGEMEKSHDSMSDEELLMRSYSNFPDLVPRPISFNVRQKQDATRHSKIGSRIFDEDTKRNIETIFLVTIILVTVISLYLFPPPLSVIRFGFPLTLVQIRSCAPPHFRRKTV